jgi:catechol 2,3-dioxygenase-like lactoylglutathione lyase family enzyme
MPQIGGIVETALYVADTAASAAFYERTLGLRPMDVGERLASVSVAERHVLLLFKKGASRHPTVFDGGTIPPNDADGQIHVAFAIPAEDFEAWQDRLTSLGVAVESVVKWQRGGRSLYFRDPDGHNIELVTPGVWEIY